MTVPRHKCAGLVAVAIVNLALFTAAYLYAAQHWRRCDDIQATGDDADAAVRHPKLHQLRLTASVPSPYVPTVRNGRRLIVIGDIHGMNTELGRLLDAARYDAATDHVITLGDMVNKGPDSRGVLSRLMSMNASAVRGNHEDHLLQALEREQRQDAVVDLRKRNKNKKILRVAKTLLPEQITWLSGLPVILKSPPLAVYFVHGGLVPGVRLDKQDPWAVMNMRTLRYSSREELRRREHDDDDSNDDGVGPAQKVIATPIDDHSGERWDKAWNKYQRKHVKPSHRRTVMYGHDAKRGFAEGEYTVGLDSGCAAGRRLTGLIVKADADARDGFSYQKIQVSCKAARNAKHQRA